MCYEKQKITYAQIVAECIKKGYVGFHMRTVLCKILR